MTRVIIETDDSWTIGKISSAINAEILLLKRSLAKTQKKYFNLRINTENWPTEAPCMVKLMTWNLSSGKEKSKP